MAPRRLAEPLAEALLSAHASPRGTAVPQEEKEVWEPFQTEDEEDPPKASLKPLDREENMNSN